MLICSSRIIIINDIENFIIIIIFYIDIQCHLTSECSPYLSSIHLIVMDPGLSMGNPKPLDQIRLAIHPNALETANTTV